jgi:phospholipid transport system substrate-binding protein
MYSKQEADMLKIKGFLFIGFYAAAIFCSFGGYAYAASPDEQLKDSVNTIIDLLRNPALKSSEAKRDRRNRIFDEVERRFDFSEMAKRTAGEYWRTMSDAEQKQFEERFAKLLENAYISKVERYTDEKVKFSPGRPKGDKYYFVPTEIISGGRSVPIGYSLRESNGQWLVYDVHIEGVSLVTNYRSQFREILAKDGFKGLMNIVDEKIRGFSAD